ncbi:MAG TPA: TonB-dependent receptor, partial [Gammaproteobacteria bacterium]|nr:TonB-dependent receptor [Gammaproteobacteria bacterium]
EMVPGLHVSEDYYSGNAIYSTRGFFRDPDAGMLLLINGVPVNSLQGGSRFAAYRQSLNNIEQIEIIRGPGSAVYGADAFVGVINIITRKYEQGQAFGAQAGSFGNRGAWMQNNFKLGKWKNHFSLQYQGADGDDSRVIDSDLQSFLDATTATRASLAPAAMTTAYDTLDLELDLAREHWRINQWLWLNRDQSNGHGLPSLDTLDPEGRVNSRASLSTLEYYNPDVSDNWSLNLRLSYLDYVADRQRYLLPGGSIAPVGADGNLFTSTLRNVNFPAGMIDFSNNREQHSQAEITAFYSGWQHHNLRLSGGYQLQRITSEESRNYGPGILDNNQSTAPLQPIDVTGSDSASLPDGERRIVYLSVQDEWDFQPDWTLTAGLRYDDYSDFGDTINPRLALVWQTRYDLSTKLLYGRAFRAPVYRELKLQNQLGYNGNSELKPETIDTLELAFDYRPRETLAGNFSLFAHQARNMIVAVEDTTIANTFTYENADTWKGYGIEAEVDWQMSASVNLSANYAWQYNRLVEKDMEAPYAPGSQLYTRLIWNMGYFWSLIPELHYVGARPRDLGETRAAIKDATRLDLMLKYQNHYKNWDFSLRLRNLLNADLREPSIGNPSITGGAALTNDVPMEGLRVMAELRYFTGK